MKITKNTQFQIPLNDAFFQSEKKQKPMDNVKVIGNTFFPGQDNKYSLKY